MTSGHDVTPSDAVDHAWHLHLTYTRDYWERFCLEVLESDLHHGPTKGGPVERDHFYHQYAATLAAYEAAFGSSPPLGIWPNAHRRFAFAPGGVRVNFRNGIFLSRWVALALGFTVFVTGLLAGRIM